MGTYLIATCDGRAKRVSGTKFKVWIGDKAYNAFSHGADRSLRLSHVESGRGMGCLTPYMAAALGNKRIAADMLISRVVERVGIQTVYGVLDAAPAVKDLPLIEED